MANKKEDKKENGFKCPRCNGTEIDEQTGQKLCACCWYPVE